MSYRNMHMEIPVDNMRKMMPTTGMEKADIEMVAAMAKAGNLHVVNPQLYGNTKFDDQNIVVSFITSKFILHTAAIKAGYSSKGRPEGNIAQRLARINTNNYFYLVMNLLSVSAITKEDLADSINNTKHTSLTTKTWQYNICRDAMHELRGVPENVAMALNVTKERVEQCLAFF